MELDLSIIENAYFSKIKKYISINQLDSYNVFLEQIIPKAIRQFNPISIYNDKLKDNIYQHEINITVGGSQDVKSGEIINDGKGIYIGKPILYKYNKELDKSESKICYPNEARLKNITYQSCIYVDIFIVYIKRDITGNIVEEYPKTSIFERQLLGNIPIMLQSKACALESVPKSMLYQMGECIYDQGGYFIIDGKEKVIISQERQFENKLYTSISDDVFYCTSEIRSMPEHTFQPARITKLTMYREKKTNQIHILDNTIRVQIPNISDDIPLFVLFRALGIISDKDILSMILYDLTTTHSKSMLQILRNTIIDSQHISTQLEALRFIQSKINPIKEPMDIKNIGEMDEESRNSYKKLIQEKENIEFGYIEETFRNYFLPHVGKNSIDKAFYLGYIVRKLLNVRFGIEQPTDRDSYMFKRIDISGFLIGAIFRDLYFRVKNHLTHSINTIYASKENPNYWNTHGIETLINSTNIKMFFNSNILTDGMRYTFKNCWGLKNSSSCKEGVVQDINRMSYLGFISHIRRVNTPISKSAKIRAPHSLHSSSWGIMCPSETPDGGNVGIRKNLALMANITIGCNSLPIEKCAILNGTIRLSELTIQEIESYTKVFINERWIGVHKHPEQFVYKFKLLRRNACINIFTSICWNIRDSEVRISTDSGRSCRPLLIVENNTLKCTPKIIDDIKDGRMDWNHLISGNLHDGDIDYYSCKYTDDITLDDLEKNSAIIEYIDIDEANTCMIASSQNDLQKNKTVKYTHCEIDPCLILGVLGANIPFIGCNQAPRNQFSNAQGKQGVGIYATNFRNRMDTKTQILFYPQRPIIDTKYSKYLGARDIPFGTNVILAIGSYSGYNQEDAIIMNKTSVERGLFRSVKFRTYSEHEEKPLGSNQKIFFCVPDEYELDNLKTGNYSKLDKRGIIKEGVRVNENDVIVGKCIQSGKKEDTGELLYNDCSKTAKRAETGIVDKVYQDVSSDDMKFCKIRVRKDKIPELGDKFASKHGQKGVIGMLIRAEDMPTTKDGIVPDMIINPFGFPKRMTVGQFLEALFSKICLNRGCFGDGTGFHQYDINNLSEVLEKKYNYERYCNELVYNGQTGEQMKMSIFMSSVYYQRLMHQVEDKVHSRNSGAKSALTKQPAGGRAMGGGLRIGEMERDALLSHGLSSFLKESMMERADKYRIYIDHSTGYISSVNPAKNIYQSMGSQTAKYFKNDNNNSEKKYIGAPTSNFSCIEVPYAFKLFVQEIESTGVGPRFVTESMEKHWKLLKEEDRSLLNQLKVDVSSKDTSNISKNSYYVSKGSDFTRPLRIFHNIIKDILLSSNKSNNSSLIDFSCGRGGDINKWISSHVKRVLGIDISRNNIESKEKKMGLGAKERYRILKQSNPKITDVDFLVADTGKDLFSFDAVTMPDYKSQKEYILQKYPKHSFDIAVSFFSIHYYFVNPQTLDMFFKNVQNSLKQNGYLLITCMDGNLVANDLKKKNPINYTYTEDKQKKKLWSIRKGLNIDLEKFDEYKHSFGQEILVEFESIGQEILEYLVHPECLVNIASKYGLSLLGSGLHSETSRNFKYLNYSSDLFKNIFPKLRDEIIQPLLNTSHQNLKKYSDYHRYFIFKNMSDVPQTFSSKIECDKTVLKKPTHTNIKYPMFSQIFLTLADETQLLQYLTYMRSMSGNSNTLPVDLSRNSIQNNDIILDKITKRLEHPFYSSLNEDSFRNTLFYMFYHLRTGIYVKIKNNILSVFLPFVNVKYNNNFYNITEKGPEFILRVDPEQFENGLSDYYTLKKKYYGKSENIEDLLPENEWFSNNCIIGNITDASQWSDNFFAEIKNMFYTLCKERDVPDVEFFINKRDFPYLKNNSTEPYHHIFDSKTKQLTKHKYDNYLPILGYSYNDEFLDISIPTHDDWMIQSNSFLKTGQTVCRTPHDMKYTSWDVKQNKGVFRGSSTGCGNTAQTNQRIRLSEISSELQSEDYNAIDAGIVKWNTRDRKSMYHAYMHFIKGNTLTNQPPYDSNIMDNIGYLSYEEQSKYKYVFYVDGWAAAYRYSTLMSMNSVILKIESVENYKLWFFDALTPYSKEENNIETADHIFIPKDFTKENIVDILDWCISNDDICRKIANNARVKFLQLFSQSYMLDYLQHLVSLVSDNIQDKNVSDFRDTSNTLYPNVEYKQSIMYIPIRKIQHLIGRKKSTLLKIENKSDTTITTSDKTRIVRNKELHQMIRIKGTIENIEIAKKEIQKISEREYVTHYIPLEKLFIFIQNHKEILNNIEKQFDVSIILPRRGIGELNKMKEIKLWGSMHNIENVKKSIQEHIDGKVEADITPTSEVRLTIEDDKEEGELSEEELDKSRNIAICILVDTLVEYKIPIETMVDNIHTHIRKHLEEDQTYKIILITQNIDPKSIPTYYFDDLFVDKAGRSQCKINTGALYNSVIQFYNTTFDTYILYNPVIQCNDELSKVMLKYPNQINIIKNNQDLYPYIYMISHKDFVSISGFKSNIWGYCPPRDLVYHDKFLYSTVINTIKLDFTYNIDISPDTYYKDRDLINTYPISDYDKYYIHLNHNDYLTTEGDEINQTQHLAITLLDNIYPFSINIQPMIVDIKDILFSPLSEFEKSIPSLFDEKIIKKGAIVSIPTIDSIFRKMKILEFDDEDIIVKNIKDGKVELVGSDVVYPETLLDQLKDIEKSYTHKLDNVYTILFNYIQVSNYTFLSDDKTTLDIHYTSKNIRVIPRFKGIQIKIKDQLPNTLKHTVKRIHYWKTIQNIIEIFNKDLQKKLDIDFVYTVHQKIKTSYSELNRVLSLEDDILNSSTIVKQDMDKYIIQLDNGVQLDPSQITLEIEYTISNLYDENIDKIKNEYDPVIKKILDIQS